MKAVAFAYLELCYGGPSRCTAPRRHSKQARMLDAFDSMFAPASDSEASCAPDGAPVDRCSILGFYTTIKCKFEV